MITIINGITDGFIGTNKIYIGRYNSRYNLNENPLHNPYKISKDKGIDRKMAIELYRRYLWESIKRFRDDKPLDRIAVELINIARVEKETGFVKLVCFCNPLPCHGDVVISAIEWLKDQDWFVDNWL